MWSFLIYETKVAVALLVFYLFYRFLLKKETFHRFNRIVLLATAVISFLLPLCIITIRRPAPAIENSSLDVIGDILTDGGAAVTVSTPWWQIALIILFWAGLTFMLVRVIVSILSIIRIIRHGETVDEEDGCKIIVTDRDINPFSWMRYIVMSRSDWEGPHRIIIDHEKAHIKYGHSLDVLLISTIAAFQWFNPAIWMLLADLQELHEYEADDAVLRAGTPIKDYQYLLIRKAVGKSGYSVANSFNHSILKNRITMMSKSKSPLLRALRVLYALPLLCLAIGLQAQTVYDEDDKVTNYLNSLDDQEIPPVVFIGSNVKAVPLIIVKSPSGEENEISADEVKSISHHKVETVKWIKKEEAIEKYGDKAENGVWVICMRPPQEIAPIILAPEVFPTEQKYTSYSTESVIMPRFQGRDMHAFRNWVNARFCNRRGISCDHFGTAKVGFTVDENGEVKDVTIEEGICEKIDDLLLSIVSSSPKWEPATLNGHAIEQRLTLPVVIRHSKSDINVIESKVIETKHYLSNKPVNN